jgi:hypothetical protein
MSDTDEQHVNEPSVEGLLKLFEFDKKKELERYCRTITISKRDFAHLVLTCEMTGAPFLHKIFYHDFVPDHLEPSEAEHKALAENGVGPLGPVAAKAIQKMSQMFEERRYLVGHVFYIPDLSRWHFFCFDQRDLEEHKPNHWKEGPHVHFLNWLWPKKDAQSVWSEFIKDHDKPGSSIHLRFIKERPEPQEMRGDVPV